jgi:hypothetical protein
MCPFLRVPELSPASATSFPLLTTATFNWLSNSKSKFCYDRRSVGQSVLKSSTKTGPKTWFLLLSESCQFVDVGCPLWQKRGSVVYNCYWPSLAQSFSSPESQGTHDHILPSQISRFPQPGGPDLSIYIPQEQGGPVASQALGSFSAPPMTRRATVEVSEPASTWETATTEVLVLVI